MKIAIIDDHVLLSQSLAQIIQYTRPDWGVKTCNSGDDFFKTDFEEWKPSMIISDILMKGMDGVQLIEKAIVKFGNTVKYILLSSITDVQTVKNAMSKGVDGYLVKDASLDELLEAIDVVMQNEQYIGQNLKDPLIKYMFTDSQLVFHLSPREKDVLGLICSGRTPKEIAFDLKLSLHTVHQYHKTIMRKFKVNRTTDLVVFAIQNGLYHVRM